MLKNKRNKKLEIIILFSLITIVCIFAIYEAIYTQFCKNNVKEVTSDNPNTSQGEDISELEKNFNYICENKLNIYNTDIDNIEKKDSDKDLVYTDYYKKESTDEFEIDVTIPKINIKEAESLNNKINSTFIQKAEYIQHNKQNGTTRYTIRYEATVIDNILSVIIDSTLKENEEPQRKIIETYNFDLATKKEINIEDILKTKNLQKEEVQNKIKETIRAKVSEAEALESLGYEVYKRDLRSDIYDIENVKNFYYGKDKVLYIIFSYGKDTPTTEKDLVIF